MRGRDLAARMANCGRYSTQRIAVSNVPLGGQQTAVPPLGMTTLSMPEWGDARWNAHLTWDKEHHGCGKPRCLLADAACAGATRLL